MTSPAAGALCGRHPGVAAVEICTRCGTFICAECVVYRPDEQAYCADCLSHFVAAPASRRANLGLGLSIGGAAGFLLGVALPVWPLALALTVAGIVLSWVELRAIVRGAAPPAGRRRARAGRLLGLVTAALMLAGLAGFVYVFIRSGGAA